MMVYLYSVQESDLVESSGSGHWGDPGCPQKEFTQKSCMYPYRDQIP